MEAIKARKMSILSAQLQIDEVLLSIKKATELGNMSIYYDELNPATKEWLIENGYKVEHLDTSNYSTYNISW
jgi:hypothetical protein